MMLPLLGPSTMLDASALPVDFATDLLDVAALDHYAFLRDGFLQWRQSKVSDGETPVATL
jgi:phospholipid-binding lipoprotein MlaA